MAISAGAHLPLSHDGESVVFLNDCLDVLNDMLFEDAELARVVSDPLVLVLRQGTSGVALPVSALAEMCMNEMSGADSWACRIISLISRTTASFSAIRSSLTGHSAPLLLSFTDANVAIPGVGSSNHRLLDWLSPGETPACTSNPLGHCEEDRTIRAVLVGMLGMSGDTDKMGSGITRRPLTCGSSGR
jgi:hypothetical protein